MTTVDINDLLRARHDSLYFQLTDESTEVSYDDKLYLLLSRLCLVEAARVPQTDEEGDKAMSHHLSSLQSYYEDDVYSHLLQGNPLVAEVASRSIKDPPKESPMTAAEILKEFPEMLIKDSSVRLPPGHAGNSMPSPLSIPTQPLRTQQTAQPVKTVSSTGAELRRSQTFNGNGQARPLAVGPNLHSRPQHNYNQPTPVQRRTQPVKSKTSGLADSLADRRARNVFASTEHSQGPEPLIYGEEDEPEDDLPFVTARDQLSRNEREQGRRSQRPTGQVHNANSRKTLGVKRRFVPPSRLDEEDEPRGSGRQMHQNNGNRGRAPRHGGSLGGGSGGGGRGGGRGAEQEGGDQENVDPRLRNCDDYLIEKIENEIIDRSDPITFEDIAGLDFAKRCVTELVIWPMARPDLFTGLRTLPRGLLLFGPPGTGKTLIGKAIAYQSGATFFNISSSSLTSKWIGEGEKLVRTLFAVASCNQPAVIFIDEIDSLLTQRSSDENEASRRIKTEFLVQIDGAGTSSSDRVLVIGATNRPQELDEAARRRFVKRLYIPLPTLEARRDLITRLLTKNDHELTAADIEEIVQRCEGFSGADVRSLCTEAAMGPIRGCVDIRFMDARAVRPINRKDFDDALQVVSLIRRLD